jgi:hypothetical protein
LSLGECCGVGHGQHYHARPGVSAMRVGVRLAMHGQFGRSIAFCATQLYVCGATWAWMSETKLRPVRLFE